MKAATAECRWRFVQAGANDGLRGAWETSCEQWCIDSDCAPSSDGFRNGFCFCPYCGGPLVLVLEPRMPAVGLLNESNA